MTDPSPATVTMRTSPARATPAGDAATGPLTVSTHYLRFPTRGEGDVVNLTDEVNALLRQTDLEAGTVTVFAPGATGAMTTLEFEPGAVRDFQRLFDQIVPKGESYRHNVLLSDGNGHSHVRAGLLGPSVTIPFVQGRLALGTWQEVVFVCFDDRPRDRRAVVQLMGVERA